MTESTVQSAFHVRFAKGYELMQSHPNHVPIMFVTSSDIKLEKHTIMCPRDSSLCNVIVQFRKNLITDIDKSSTMGFIFYIKTEDEKMILPKQVETIGELHDRYRWSDMWLRVQINQENVFG
jgi:hypothetical protein